MILLLVIVVNLLLCLIYKLNFLTSMYVGEKHNIYIKLSTIRDFRYPLGVLECVECLHRGMSPLCRSGGTTVLHGIFQKNWTGKNNIFCPRARSPSVLWNPKRYFAGNQQVPGSDPQQFNTSEPVAGLGVICSLGSWGSIYRFGRVFFFS